MKIKTSELQGATLDWAVAKCEGITLTSNGYIEYVVDHLNSEFTKYTPSTDWSQSGPIIEREKITIQYWIEEGWRACCKFLHDPIVCCSGSTILIAAMRCYVASKIGDEVDIPEELL